MASASTSKDSAKRSKPKTAPSVKPDIASQVDSASSGNDSESGSDAGTDSESVDSDQDLENVEPRRNKGKETARKSIAPAGSFDKYKPPAGMTELGITTEFVKSEFEWDALASRPGIELWAIRAPRDLKPSRLSALSIPVPKKDEPLTGNLKTKSQSYILRTAGFTGSSSSSKVGEQGQGLVDSLGMSDEQGVDQLAEEGGEEMGGMRLLVPRVKEHGKLYVAPLPISRHLILTPDFSTESNFDAQTAEPILDFLNEAQQASSSSSSSAPPAKRAQPTHLMKFRNHTYGFNTPGPEKTSKKLRGEVMNVEQQVEREAAPAAAAAVASEMAVESKKEKKRKTEKDDSPAKAKKKAKKSKD
ncbi:hypothetical protein I314_03013 [Cryptococcus bacillisporus CA1873]|uniref:Uncharacterized protein n=1 Tax=Cryptococcus bacillisporus CA1873 TaxID=1296111 RepID=A0ABR5BBB9_CRYGA|nr:hypothetical protein I314_03013 [Cryptococcus bacillisporus CA1873]|eukprot:KIR63609.1 hypothetical protein I314_03013 [Cryptococcus gattii CA1873]